MSIYTWKRIGTVPSPMYRDSSDRWHIVKDGPLYVITDTATTPRPDGMHEIYTKATSLAQAKAICESVRAKECELERRRAHNTERRAEVGILTDAERIAQKVARAEAHDIAHDRIAGATFVGTMSKNDMARMIRLLSTALLDDGNEQRVRVDLNGHGLLSISTDSAPLSASVYITDSVVHVKGA